MWELHSPNNHGGSLMVVETAQCIVQLGQRPRRDYTLHNLSGQVERLDPRTAKCTVGSSLDRTLCNSKSQACRLSL